MCHSDARSENDCGPRRNAPHSHSARLNINNPVKRFLTPRYCVVCILRIRVEDQIWYGRTL